LNKHFFQQQQQRFTQHLQNAKQQGLLQKLLAWLLIGLMLVVGLSLLVFFLVLSWVLIPILLIVAYIRRKRGKTTHTQQSGQVFDAEVIDRKED